MSIVVCKLPKAGLGNQLFPLMKAYTFAYLNKLPVVVTDYHQVKIGPYLRREKTKRKYSGFFTFQKNILSAHWDKWKLKKYNQQQVIEPLVQKMNDKDPSDEMYVFSAMPHWDYYFEGLKENRPIVIDLFWKLISKKVYNKLTPQSTPCIGVHIRMGDFRKLNEGEDFSKAGIVRTPESYFADIINSIRSIHCTELPVSIFTDGYKHEFDKINKLNNVTWIEGNNDLVDLLLLSKSRIIVTSATSTFSYWAAFLSDAVVIMHPDHVKTEIRPANVNDKHYQGVFDSGNTLLIKSIRAIR